MPVPQKLEAADLIRPLSKDALEYFAAGRIVGAEEPINTSFGKFIRAGGLILIGALVSIGESGYCPPSLKIDHEILLDYIKNAEDESFSQALSDSSQECQLQGQPLNDAGFTLISSNPLSNQYELIILGNSGVFRDIPETSRQHTINIAKLILAPTVEVTGIAA